jgi:hypothetical protein
MMSIINLNMPNTTSSFGELGLHNTWSKETTAAPALSQLEIHPLTSLAMYLRRVLKNYDVKLLST